MGIYFTADLHLGHENILKSRLRFHTVQEMDQRIIQNWNETVRGNDEVYILGDLMFRNKSRPQFYLEQLNGKKHLIIGNHDKDWMKKLTVPEMYRYFQSVREEFVLKMDHMILTLSHYPWIEFPGYNKNSGNAYMIHGHIHATKSDAYQIIKKYLPYHLNCSQDVCRSKPVMFDELRMINKYWYDRDETTE